MHHYKINKFKEIINAPETTEHCANTICNIYSVSFLHADKCHFSRLLVHPKQ